MNKIILEDINNIVEHVGPLINSMDINSVLITGANGMIGSYLLMTFLNFSNTTENSIKIFSLCRNENKAREKFKNVEGIDQVTFLYQDVCDELTINYPIDLIIHAASQASPKYYNIDPVGTMLANIDGTRKLLDFSLKNGTKEFLFISSSEIYGAIPDDEQPIDESTIGMIDTTNSRSCYAESKRAGETLAIAYKKQYGLTVKIVRPFHTYGPTMDYGDGRIFSLITDSISDGCDIVFKSDGSAKRAFCYLTDAIEGLIHIIARGRSGEAYNLGNPQQEVSMRNLAEDVIVAIDRQDINLILDYDKQSNAYAISKVTRNQPEVSKLNALGWSPSVSYVDGFLRCINSKNMIK